MKHFPTVDRLHTDVLSEKYGPMHVEMGIQNYCMREAHLVDNLGISRTYAVTIFGDEIENPDVQKVDEEIRDGALIGETFRNHGYGIRKNVIDVYSARLPNWLKDRFKTGVPFAKARLSEFYAKKEGDNPFVYGDVLEVYSPDFRSPVINAADNIQINPTISYQEQHGLSKEEIWNRLGSVDSDDLEALMFRSDPEHQIEIAEKREMTQAFMYNK